MPAAHAINQVRVGIVDEYPTQVAGVAAAINASTTMRVVMTAGSGAEAMQATEHDVPDILLVEPWMRTGDGIACINRIHRDHPDVPVVALSRMWDEAHVREARAAGAVAHVPKTTPPEDLPAILRQVLAGAEVRPAVAAASPGAADLTAREREVLALAARGMPNSEIADALYVTEQTVKFHLSNVYRKLGVHNRTEASHRAARTGILG